MVENHEIKYDGVDKKIHLVVDVIRIIRFKQKRSKNGVDCHWGDQQNESRADEDRNPEQLSEPALGISRPKTRGRPVDLHNNGGVAPDDK